MMLLGSMATLNGQAQETLPAKQPSKASHTLSANASPGWITTKVFTPQGKYSWRFGMGGELNYRCLFHSGYGFGLEYAYNQTGYPVAGSVNENLKINYAGASFVYGGTISSGWIAAVSLGMGYANYAESGESHSGFGTKTSLSIERQLNKVLGIGLELGHHVLTFSKQESNDYYDADEYTNGFKRLSVSIGFRIHI